MKKQVFVVHGGNTFKTYDDYISYLENYEITQEKIEKLKNGNWKENLQKDLGEDYEVILLKMPNAPFQLPKILKYILLFSSLPQFFEKTLSSPKMVEPFHTTPR